MNDTNRMLDAILDAEGGGGSGGGGATQSRDEIISTVAIEIAAKVPANYDMEFAQLKYPVLWEQSMNTVLCQELIRFNNLLSVMRESLVNIQKAVKGWFILQTLLPLCHILLFTSPRPSSSHPPTHHPIPPPLPSTPPHHPPTHPFTPSHHPSPLPSTPHPILFQVSW